MAWVWIIIVLALGLGTVISYLVAMFQEKRERKFGVTILIPITDIPITSKDGLAKRKGNVNFHVVKKDNLWVLRKSNSSQLYLTSKKKRTAVLFATEYAKRQKTELKIHNKKGLIIDSISYGNDPIGNG